MRVKGYHRLTSAHLLVSRNFYLHAINCLGISALLQVLLPSPLTMNLAWESWLISVLKLCGQRALVFSTLTTASHMVFRTQFQEEITVTSHLWAHFKTNKKTHPNKMRTYFPFLTTRRNSTVPEVFIPHHHIF